MRARPSTTRSSAGGRFPLQIFDVFVCLGRRRQRRGELGVVRQQVLHGLANEIDAVVQILDRRVDFMGDARGQPADGFEMLALRQPLLGELAFGDVEADADDADHMPFSSRSGTLEVTTVRGMPGDLVEARLFEIDDGGAGFEQRLLVGIELLREIGREKIEIGLADRVCGDRCPCCGRARRSWR